MVPGAAFVIPSGYVRLEHHDWYKRSSKEVRELQREKERAGLE